MLLLHRSLSAIFESLPESVNHKFFIPWDPAAEDGKQTHRMCFNYYGFSEAQSFVLVFSKACPIFCLAKGRGKKIVFSSYCLKYISAHISHSASDMGLLWSWDIGLNGAFLYSGSADLCNRTYQTQYSLWIKRAMSSGRAGMGEVEDSSELCNGVAEVGYTWCCWYFIEYILFKLPALWRTTDEPPCLF